METLIVYMSTAHGNTEKLARRMAETLEGTAVTADETDPVEISRFDLVGFGSGVYAMRPDNKLIQLVKRVSAQKGKKAFLFFTAGIGSPLIIRIATIPFKRLISGKGYDIVGEFSCPGYDSFGPLRLMGGINKGRPGDKDLERASRFASSIRVSTEAPGR